MKKFVTLLAFIALFAMVSESNAQLYKKSWSVGFGVDYPRWTSGIADGYWNYGVFLGVKRTFTEHTALRLNGKYQMLEGKFSGTNTANTGILGLDIDFMYSLTPCETIKPYVYLGVGGYYAMFDKTPSKKNGNNLDDYLDYKINYGFGAEWVLSPKWNLVTELGFNTAASSKLDGQYGTDGGGPLGTYTDTYMHLSIGAAYYWGQKDESKLCQLYDGIKLDEMPDPVDYEKIENIVRKYIPREVVKEVVVDKGNGSGMTFVPMDKDGNWILVGVNFDFNSSKLTAESYPILFHAAQVLLQNTDVNVDIVGYTDNIGTKAQNKKISERRAQTVKNYLIAKGVAASRLSIMGMGEDNPIADNKTAAGRAANRRIEFKVK